MILLEFNMTQTQTETSIPNGKRRVRTPEEILGEPVSVSVLPSKTSETYEVITGEEHVWLGLFDEKADSFYTLKKGSSRAVEATAAIHPYINWAVKARLSMEHAILVPKGLTEHVIFTQDDLANGLEGVKSYLDLRKFLLKEECAFEEPNHFLDFRQLLLTNGRVYRDPNDLRGAERVRTFRISRY